MTITTIQYQTVNMAVQAILNGENVADLFTPTLEALEAHPNMKEAVQNTSDLVLAFDIDAKQKFEHYLHDMEVAIDTLENVAQNIVNMYDMSIFSELSDYHDFDETCELIENENIRVWYDVYNMADLAQQYLEETDSLTHVALDGNYIDEAQLLHDLHCNSEVTEYYYCQAKEDALEEGKTEEEAIEIASDYEVSDDDEQQFLEMVVESIVHDKTMLERYFDYEAYGKDMEYDSTFYTFDNGMIEVIW